MGILINFLNRDINDKNEVKKTAVATRYCCFLMLIYAAVFAIAILVNGSYQGLEIGIIMILGYVVAMSMTYGTNIQRACIVFDVAMLFSIIQTVIWFGWGSGIQHFLFALVLYNILFVRMSVRSQLIGAFSVCFLRLGLYFFCREVAPKYTLSDGESVFIQILSTIFVFMIIIACAVNYAIENQNTENTLRKYNRTLEKIASTDPLTQLWNRHKMLEYIKGFLKANGTPFCSVCICDIDFFKRINDSYGHEGGDKVLVSLAQLCDEEMSKCGAVARWGGEEFLLFFTNLNGDEALKKLGEIQQKIRDMVIPYEGHELQVTMTFGLVEYDHYMSIDENIKIADDRLYLGKEKGRDRIVY